VAPPTLRLDAEAVRKIHLDEAGSGALPPQIRGPGRIGQFQSEDWEPPGKITRPTEPRSGWRGKCRADRRAQHMVRRRLFGAGRSGGVLPCTRQRAMAMVRAKGDSARPSHCSGREETGNFHQGDDWENARPSFFFPRKPAQCAPREKKYLETTLNPSNIGAGQLMNPMQPPMRRIGKCPGLQIHSV